VFLVRSPLLELDGRIWCRIFSLQVGVLCRKGLNLRVRRIFIYPSYLITLFPSLAKNTRGSVLVVLAITAHCKAVYWSCIWRWVGGRKITIMSSFCRAFSIHRHSESHESFVGAFLVPKDEFL
jgi:hypothetical protein